MKKTDTFFLIHNYNTVPGQLLSYCQDYLVVDASDDGVTPGLLMEQGIRFVSVENTGHNITTYFQYFADHYEELPEVICICKGNMLGRHCSEEYFQRVYDQKFFTYLYEDRAGRARYAKAGTVKGEEDQETSRIACLLSESQYIEENTSWYVDSPNHPNRYFDCLDDLLEFIFVDPVIPRYCLFSPGACYILRREQILRHSPSFYRNLNKVMGYGMDPSFPSEAHMVERILPLIFEAAYEEQPWMGKEADFDRRLEEREKQMQQKEAERSCRRNSMIRRIARRVRKTVEGRKHKQN